MFCPILNDECNENCAVTSKNDCGVKYLINLSGILEEIKAADTQRNYRIIDLEKPSAYAEGL